MFTREKMYFGKTYDLGGPRPEGSSSGQGYIAIYNKAYGSFHMLEICRELGRSFKLKDVDGSGDHLLLNNGDDNLFLSHDHGFMRAFAEFIAANPTFRGLPIKVEVPLAWNAMILFERKKGSDYIYSWHRSLINTLNKLFAPEYHMVMEKLVKN